ncbi:MAG: diacylglycerol kinase family protein, partial [Oscillospiraceae bacterium]
MNKLKEQRRALQKSFLYAFRGIAYCIKNERNMRLHISAAVIVAAFSFVYHLSSVEYGMLLFAIGFVIVAEMFNTGIEVVINLEMP